MDKWPARSNSPRIWPPRVAIRARMRTGGLNRARVPGSGYSRPRCPYHPAPKRGDVHLIGLDPTRGRGDQEDATLRDHLARRVERAPVHRTTYVERSRSGRMLRLAHSALAIFGGARLRRAPALPRRHRQQAVLRLDRSGATPSATASLDNLIRAGRLVPRALVRCKGPLLHRGLPFARGSVCWCRCRAHDKPAMQRP